MSAVRLEAREPVRDRSFATSSFHWRIQGFVACGARSPALTHPGGLPILVRAGVAAVAAQALKEREMFFDPLYMLMILPALVLSIWAQAKVKRAFKKYSEVPSSTGLTGAQVAQAILDANGIRGVPIEVASGMLSDHYDPAHRVLRLSEDVYHGRSVAAAGVAAHECGHALQHKMAYTPLVLRQTIAPAAIWGSNLSWILMLVGFFLQATSLVWGGIALFSVAVLFTLVTLPVEFDASRRAKEVLPQLGLVSTADREGVSAVLDAAAMTYVAAAATAVLQLIYFILRANSRD